MVNRGRRPCARETGSVVRLELREASLFLRDRCEQFLAAQWRRAQVGLCGLAWSRKYSTLPDKSLISRRSMSIAAVCTFLPDSHASLDLGPIAKPCWLTATADTRS